MQVIIEKPKSRKNEKKRKRNEKEEEKNLKDAW